MRCELQFLSGNGLKQGESVLKIVVVNKLDQNNSANLENLILLLHKSGIKKFLLDLNELKYVDSSAIGKIINVTKIIRKTGGEISISRVTSDIMNIFNLIKLGTFIKIFSTNEEAVNYLALA